MKARPKKPDTMSRRSFVAMVAAGSAALLAPASVAAPVARPGARARAAAEAMSPANRREYVRQKGVTIDTLKVIRKHDMPPGTELASVFRPLKPARRQG